VLGGGGGGAMTDEIQQATLNVVKRWLKIRGKPGDTQLCADIDHSALLVRLLDGKEPLPAPPPRANSYPWYDLIESGKGEAMEVWRYPGWPGILCINQSGQWSVIEAHDDGSYLARCTTNGQVFDVIPCADGYWSLCRVESEATTSVVRNVPHA